MQIMKGLKKGETTFIATIASSGEDNDAKDPLPLIVEKVLEENKDVIPKELPRHMPLRREVDHKVELDLREKSLASSPHCMAPLELEELRKHLRKLLEAGYI